MFIITDKAKNNLRIADKPYPYEIKTLELQLRALKDRRDFLPRQIELLKREQDQLPKQITALQNQLDAMRKQK
jgi:chaperonin cofactor prefoldin